MDAFKRASFKNIGPGGINCSCCVNFPKKRKNHKKMIRRTTRRVLKQELHSIISS